MMDGGVMDAGQPGRSKQPAACLCDISSRPWSRAARHASLDGPLAPTRLGKGPGMARELGGRCNAPWKDK